MTMTNLLTHTLYMITCFANHRYMR